MKRKTEREKMAIFAPQMYSVLKELQESASYWSEYDVPLGIVDRINDILEKVENIQTPIRLINVKESYEEVYKAMDLQWMELTEDTSFYGEMSGKMHNRERKIRLNRNYIIEVQP